MRHRGTPFAGLLYVGLALTSRGMRVVEFNARFGDPETQAVLAMLDSPLGQVLHAAASGTLADVGPLRWKPGAAVVVVLAADGYHGAPSTGGEIRGKRLFGSADPDGTGDTAHVIHAGTALHGDVLVAQGGRVLGVVAQAAGLAEARAKAYAAVAEIDFPTGFHRSDIAARPSTANPDTHPVGPGLRPIVGGRSSRPAPSEPVCTVRAGLHRSSRTGPFEPICTVDRSHRRAVCRSMRGFRLHRTGPARGGSGPRAGRAAVARPAARRRRRARTSGEWPGRRGEERRDDGQPAANQQRGGSHTERAGDPLRLPRDAGDLVA
jgi:hypothetical protein